MFDTLRTAKNFVNVFWWLFVDLRVSIFVSFVHPRIFLSFPSFVYFYFYDFFSFHFFLFFFIFLRYLVNTFIHCVIKLPRFFLATVRGNRDILTNNFDMLKFILGPEVWGNKTNETYYLLLRLKMISFVLFP